MYVLCSKSEIVCTFKMTVKMSVHLRIKKPSNKSQKNGTNKNIHELTCTAMVTTEKCSLLQIPNVQQIIVTAAQMSSHICNIFSHHVRVFDIGVENHVTQDLVYPKIKALRFIRHPYHELFICECKRSIRETPNNT